MKLLISPKSHHHAPPQPLCRVPQVHPHLILPHAALVVGVEERIHAPPVHGHWPSDVVAEERKYGEPGQEGAGGEEEARQGGAMVEEAQG